MSVARPTKERNEEYRYNNVLLLLIAIALLAIAIEPVVRPRPAQAQTAVGYRFYIEPGVQTLMAPDGSRQVLGKVVVDMRTGKVWGFPTLSQLSYPSDPMNSRPTTSHPFALGRFAFEDTDK
jgi:hypothetical protein